YLRYSTDALATNWSGWRQFGGTTTSAPTLEVFNNRLFMSIRGTDDNIYTRYSTDSLATQWSAWDNDGGATLSAPDLQVFNGRLYQAHRGTDNQIYLRYSTDALATNWSGWRQFGGTTTSAPTLEVFNNRLFMSIRGTDDNIYTRYSTDSLATQWSSWDNDGGATPSAPYLAVFNGRLIQSHQGLDQRIYSRHSLDPLATSWSGWREFGGLTPTGTDDTPMTPSDRIPGLQDASIRTLVNTALGDNLFTHQELSSLLRSTATNGVTATEIADLRRISGNLSSYLSANSRSYIQYIFNAVVNGNTANQWWTGGGSTRVTLGNLTAGSTQQHLNRLVGKWFGGLDLPTNFVGGDSAAGTGSITFSYGQMTGSLFVNGISFSDVNQGQAGNCYFHAAASTLANNQSQFIQTMFLGNADGTYGVRFYGSSGNEVWVTVNRAVPVVEGRLALAGNATRSLGGEMWVALAEKAYAQANEIGQFGRPTTANSYRHTEGGMGEALRHISNRPITTFSSFNNSLTTWNSYLNTAIAAVNAGRSLWLGSFGDTYDSSGKRNLVSSHAFAIIGYNSSTQRFTLANPWGPGNPSYAGVFEATWGQLFNVRGVVSWA
ncbi:C2 family cysteine protease, partial [Leptolyngbya sp. AN02str]|uniref:C2 family cysteine protease n=1 Tax=Leptolyngbya sp. AN02str TaxID=3423363 RepID=UPI003D30F9DB